MAVEDAALVRALFKVGSSGRDDYGVGIKEVGNVCGAGVGVAVQPGEASQVLAGEYVVSRGVARGTFGSGGLFVSPAVTIAMAARQAITWSCRT